MDSKPGTSGKKFKRDSSKEDASTNETEEPSTIAAQETANDDNNNSTLPNEVNNLQVPESSMVESSMETDKLYEIALNIVNDVEANFLDYDIFGDPVDLDMGETSNVGNAINDDYYITNIQGAIDKEMFDEYGLYVDSEPMELCNFDEFLDDDVMVFTSDGSAEDDLHSDDINGSNIQTMLIDDSQNNTTQVPTRPEDGKESTISSTLGTGMKPEEPTTSNSLKLKSNLKKSKFRCAVCRKNVGLCGITCRCGGLYCSKHRYVNGHNCTYDYKAHGAEEIRRNNPLVIAEKVVKL